MSPPKESFSPIYIPLLNVQESGIRLRPEFTLVCDYAGISPSSILNLSDIKAGFKKPENIRWILVDHNKTEGRLGNDFKSHVSGVIDHHTEEHAVPVDIDPEPRIIERAGSCTSLVVRYCMPAWDIISSASLSSGAGHAQGEGVFDDSIVARGWDSQIARMALASILIDTTDLTAPGKVEEVDLDAVVYLEAKIQLSANAARTWDRNKIYQTISDAKSNIEHLSFQEIMIKDYKEWDENGQKIGITSVVKPLDFLAQKCKEEADSDSGDSFLEEALGKFMVHQDLSVLCLMTASKPAMGEFRRELLIQAKDIGFDTAERFSSNAIKAFDLEEMNVDAPRQIKPSLDETWRNFWVQKDLSKSRKQIAPLLRDAAKNLEV